MKFGITWVLLLEINAWRRYKYGYWVFINGAAFSLVLCQLTPAKLIIIVVNSVVSFMFHWFNYSFYYYHS